MSAWIASDAQGLWFGVLSDVSAGDFPVFPPRAVLPPRSQCDELAYWITQDVAALIAGDPTVTQESPKWLLYYTFSPFRTDSDPIATSYETDTASPHGGPDPTPTGTVVVSFAGPDQEWPTPEPPHPPEYYGPRFPEKAVDGAKVDTYTIIGEVQLMDGISRGPGFPTDRSGETDYPWGPTAVCVLQDGTLFAGCQIYSPNPPYPTWYRCWHFKTDGTILGTLDTDFDVTDTPGYTNDYGTVCHGIHHNRVFVAVGGSFGGAGFISNPNGTMIFDCTGDTPKVVTKKKFNMTVFGGGPGGMVLGDAFSCPDSYYDPEADIVVILHETWGTFRGGFGVSLSVFEASTGKFRGTRPLENSFEVTGVGPHPDNPQVAVAVPYGLPFYYVDVVTLELIKTDAGADWIRGIGDESFHMATGSPFHSWGIAVDYMADKGLPYGTVALRGIAEDYTQAAKTQFDLYFAENVCVRPQRVMWVGDGGFEPDTGPPFDPRGTRHFFGAASYTRPVQFSEMDLPWPADVVALAGDSIDGLLVGSPFLSYDPRSGVVVAGYNILWDDEVNFTGEHTTPYVWVIQGPPDDLNTPLRGVQRDDGRGVHSHPRMDTPGSMPNHPTSVQHPRAPRQPQIKNTYT